MPQVFIAHSGRDRIKVEKIVAVLEEHPEINVWYAKREIQSGKKISESITKAIGTSSVFLLCASMFTYGKRMGPLLSIEQEEALARMKEDASFRVISVLIDEDAELPDAFLRFKSVDLSSSNWLQKIDLLTTAILR